ncbi:deoxyguanosinetriphosphate triphosphohydrolase [Phototrophicus methaneseepsis]|uniref:Deoxyguanosinetriphosphate triphosphohydrolase-like protein n=1 Tax=Phototrophicus methaneseepsis TaxID=2710758 RepID=A0A7S8E5Y7_9CHLR|nr:deoxyguanosinetriphosphate triphosphohydrolase [Phototrophicus methaneseepsis]QPC80960.1 deoxyguanosinetriphosphate triphosphohydrolase [Phototrophicus methaneseepsis]
MYMTREKLEEMEAQILAPYALLSKNSKGRVYPDHEPDYRTAFQRDRDRIVHAEAFRKLEYKTQVFVNDLGDYYRTRLTHTLEVAQIGRTLARALGANEDLVETICLAHDLGHPPFGHSGEYILNDLMADHGGFNHNHQSYRVVTELERRYPDWPGLNLSFETLEGIAKHETDYDLSVVADYDPTLCGSLEAQISNIADELAYNAHDLDDGLQAGLLTPQQMEGVAIWRLLCERLDWQGCILSEIDRHRFIRELVGLLVGSVIDETLKTLQAIHAQSPDDVQKHSKNVVGYSVEQANLNRELKDFLYHNMYYHWRVTRMKHRAEHFVQHLFESYIAEPRQLPPDYQAQIDVRGLHRVVADYIASMTDRSAVLEYRRLFDPMTRP